MRSNEPGRRRWPAPIVGDGDAAAAAAREFGDAHRGCACNVTDKPACEAAVAKVVDEFGRGADALVNNAGIPPPAKTLASRLGDAEDVARACPFLASDPAPYTPGAVLDVNGRPAGPLNPTTAGTPVSSTIEDNADYR